MARLIFSGMAYITVTKHTDHYNGSLSFPHNEQFFLNRVFKNTSIQYQQFLQMQPSANTGFYS